MPIVELAAVSTALSALKTISEIVKNVSSIDLTQKIIELQRSILDMQSAIGELTDENRRLKEQIASNDRVAELEQLMVYEQSVYWKRTGNGDERETEPYCTVCWEKDRRLSHLHRGATPGTYTCQVDQTSYLTRSFDPRY